MKKTLMISTAFATMAQLGCLSPSTDAPAKAPEVVTGEQLTITGQAALTGCDTCPDLDPSLSYQTPSALLIGVSEVSLLRAVDDPNPHLLLTVQPAQEADLVQGAVFAQVDTGSIPEGEYTHMQVKLDWIRYAVDATGHALGLNRSGVMDVDYVLSNYSDPDLGDRLQGEYLASFATMGLEIPQAGIQPITYPPSHPGGTVDLSGQSYRITFPMPEGPLNVSHRTPESVDIDVTYFIENAFGWQENTAPNFADGVFDLDRDPLVTEIPKQMVIRGFEMDVVHFNR